MKPRNPKAYLFARQNKSRGKEGQKFPVTPGEKARPSWEGSLLFGQVQVPVLMFAATEDRQATLVLLDKNDLGPVGMRSYNKNTGASLSKDDVIRGFLTAKGAAVALSKEDLQISMPKTTQVMAVESVVNPHEVPPAYFLKSYHLRPAAGAEKAFAVVRDALKATSMGAITRIVVATRQYAALILPDGYSMAVHLLRWATEVRAPRGPVVETQITQKELAAAKQLVMALVKPWNPDALADEFSDKIQQLAVMKEVAPAEPLKVLPGEEVPARVSGKLLEDMLKESAKLAAPPKPPRAKAAKTPAPAKGAPKKPKAPDVKATAAKKAVATKKVAPVAPAIPVTAKKARSIGKKLPQKTARAPAKKTK